MKKEFQKHFNLLLDSLKNVWDSFEGICHQNMNYCNDIFSELDKFNEFKPLYWNAEEEIAHQISIESSNEITQIAVKELEIDDGKFEELLLKKCLNATKESIPAIL